MAKNGETTTLTLAEFSTGRVHNIRLIRQTEARNAIAAISSVSFTGYFESKPADARYFVEFITATANTP